MCVLVPVLVAFSAFTICYDNAVEHIFYPEKYEGV